jgi:hypothetical protein
MIPPTPAQLEKIAFRKDAPFRDNANTAHNRLFPHLDANNRFSTGDRILPREPVRAKPVAFFDDTRPFAFLGVLFSGPQHRVPGHLLVPAVPPIPTSSMIPMNLGYIVKAREVAVLAGHLAGTP